MGDFDRDAIVARTKSTGGGGKAFWIAVAALPVIGVAVGLSFSGISGGTGRGAADAGITQSAQTRPAETARPVLDETSAAEEGPVYTFSAHAELDRYRMTLATLKTCGGGYNPEPHYAKAIANYISLNRPAHDALLVKARNEPDPNEIEFAEIPETRLGVMAGAVTGSLQREAVKRMKAFEEGFDRADRLSTGYLGKSPSPSDCQAFRNEVVMGKHNPRLS